MAVFLFSPQGIPTLVNRHDRNYEVILRDIKAKVPQVSRDLQWQLDSLSTGQFIPHQ